jgi:hypothetical protein
MIVLHNAGDQTHKPASNNNLVLTDNTISVMKTALII